MSSLSNNTQDIELRNPELWTLILHISEKSVKFILYNDAEDNSLISRELSINTTGNDYLRALENCIYDNPVLIQDFKRVAVSVTSPHFAIIPSEMSEEDTLLDIMDYMYANDEGERCNCTLPDNNVTIAYTLPHGVTSFLQRTFNMPLIVHSLVPLCTYSSKKSEKSGITKMYTHISDNNLDLCVFNKGELIMANTYRLRDIDEATYYMLMAWQSLKLDAMNDELQLSADKKVRDQITPQLRKYINYVMPIIFPASAMKIGQDAMKAPFDLILLSQCVL